MSALLAALAAAPVPSPSPTVTPAGGGSPGFLGFVVTFVLALAAAGIFLSLTRHLRIVDRRAREQAAEDDAAASDAVSPSHRDGSGPLPPADEHRA